jgi:phosphinothricin acetyltransferase
MQPESVLIRPATVADIAAITAIYGPEVETGLASWEEIPPSADEMAARMEKLQSAGLPYLAAESAGRLLGYAYAGPFHPRAAYRFTLEDTVYVHPDAQGRGVGRALLEQLLADCTAQGYRQMMALIHFTPDSASIALHQQLGFRMIGVATALGYKLGAWRDLAQLQLSLGAGNATEPGPLAARPRTAS